MNNANDFILTTDYATSKADSFSVHTVSVPGSIFIPGLGYDLRYVDVEVGTRGSILRTRIASSKAGNRFYATSQLNALRMVPTFVFYSVYATAVRVSPSTLRLMVITPNATSVGFTTEAGTEIFQFEVSTVIPPVE